MNFSGVAWYLILDTRIVKFNTQNKSVNSRTGWVAERRYTIDYKIVITKTFQAEIVLSTAPTVWLPSPLWGYWGLSCPAQWTGTAGAVKPVIWRAVRAESPLSRCQHQHQPLTNRVLSDDPESHSSIKSWHIHVSGWRSCSSGKIREIRQAVLSFLPRGKNLSVSCCRCELWPVLTICPPEFYTVWWSVVLWPSATRSGERRDGQETWASVRVVCSLSSLLTQPTWGTDDTTSHVHCRITIRGEALVCLIHMSFIG